MIETSSRVERTFRLVATPDATWALLADVPRWGHLFPHVTAVEPFPDAGPDAYRWAMAPLGPPGARVETVYACRYVRQPDGRVLAWTPIEGVGNARFEGEVRLRPDGEGTAGTLRLDATLQIPAPAFARAIVEPAVAFEMGRMTETFLGRLDAEIAHPS